MSASASGGAGTNTGLNGGMPGVQPTMAGLPSTGSPSWGPDHDGVGLLKVAALIGLLSQALLWAGIIFLGEVIAAIDSAVSTLGGVSSLPGWITVSTFYAIVAMVLVGTVLGIVAYVFSFLGFRRLREASPMFGTPAVLAVVGLIGFAMIAGGLGLIVGAVLSVISSDLTGSSATVALSAVLGGAGLVLLGILLWILGVIGIILGNWRAGTRYESGLLKAGSILTIIPVVSIVAYVLLLIGYAGTGKKLESGWRPAVSVQVPGNMALGTMAVVYANPGYPLPSPAGNPTAAVLGNPAAIATAPGSPQVPACPSCGRPTSFVPQYNRSYCYSCGRYA